MVREEFTADTGYCSGYTLLKGFNDLATTHPDLAAEWSERNHPLLPDEVNAKSRRNVWWKCKTCGNPGNRVETVPVWVKPYLTIDEATAYTGIGRDKLYEMTSQEKCPFVLWVGNRRMIKRRVFDEYIEKMYSI